MQNNVIRNIWTVKYRPKNLDELVLTPQLKARFDKWLRQDKVIPNLIFLGSPGTGNTSIGNVIVNELNAQYIVLNSSDERGIDTIREKIKTFAMTYSDRIKIVFLDGADQLTVDAQQSLRNIMETYAGNTRFVFTGNYDNFIEPLKDRCTVIMLHALPKPDVFGIAERILKNEGVEYDEKDLKEVINALYPSLRSITNAVQNNIVRTEGGKRRFVFKHIALSEREQVMESIFQTLIRRGALEARRRIIETGWDNWWDELYRYFFEKALTPVEKLIVSEYMYRHQSVPDKELNFSAMLYAIESGLLPYNYFPEIASIRTATYGLRLTERKVEPKKKSEEDIDIEKLLNELADTDV